MSNKNNLKQFYEEEINIGLVDIKFFPGETSTSSEESFCGAVYIALQLDKQGLSKEIEEL